MRDEETVTSITIPMEEYRSLLITKGKYEELKEWSMPHIYPTTITYDGQTDKELKPPYTVTCATYMNDELEKVIK